MIEVNTKQLFAKAMAVLSSHSTRKSGPVDNKDILAFIIALYQLFVPVLLGLFIAGTIVSLIILFLFH